MSQAPLFSLEETDTVRPLPVYAAHALKSWSRCKKQFYYQTICRLYWPSDPSGFRLGRDVHKLLDYQAREMALDCTPLVENADADVQKAWQLLTGHPSTQWPVIASEWAFNVPVFSTEGTVVCWLNGRMDRIAQMPEEIEQEREEKTGRVVIIDWKTGTAAPKLPQEDWQTRLYLYALVEARMQLGLTDLTPEQVSFLYVEVKDTVRTLAVSYSQYDHQATKALLLATHQAISAETEYPLPDTCPDRFCPYRAICGIASGEG